MKDVESEELSVSAMVNRIRSMIGKVTFDRIRVNVSQRVDVDYRSVDRALQRARKAGAIKFDSKRGWTVVEKST